MFSISVTFCGLNSDAVSIQTDLCVFICMYCTTVVHIQLKCSGLIIEMARQTGSSIKHFYVYYNYFNSDTSTVLKVFIISNIRAGFFPTVLDGSSNLFVAHVVAYPVTL